MPPALRIRRILPALVILLLLPSLAQGQLLDRRYVGVLHVTHTCPLPQFSESAQMQVEVMQNGSVLITDSAMSYGGVEDLDGCTYTRTGDWTIAPYGWYRVGPPVHVEVIENIQFSEHIKMECPPPVGVVMDEYPSGLYDGGLAFMWDEATTGGAVVSGTGDPQNDVVWTLTLIPGLPVEDSSWSMLKALFAE